MLIGLPLIMSFQNLWVVLTNLIILHLPAVVVIRDVIEGTTPIGRATCLRLDLNDTRYPEEDSIRETRRFWIQTGLHPPTDDPCQD